MSTRKADIRAALRTHLLAVVDLPDVNWEGKTFEAPKDELYLRETLLPADESVSANDELTGIGIYQIDVIFPIGYKLSEAESMADNLKEHFRPSQVIDFVTTEKATVGQVNDTDPPWLIIPVQIDYRVHKINFKPA